MADELVENGQAWPQSRSVRVVCLATKQVELRRRMQKEHLEK